MPAAEPRWGAHLMLSDPLRGGAVFCPVSCLAGCWISLHPAGDDLEQGMGWDDYSATEVQLYRVLRRGSLLDFQLLPLPPGRVRCRLRRGFYEPYDLAWAMALLHPRCCRGLRSLA